MQQLWINMWQTFATVNCNTFSDGNDGRSDFLGFPFWYRNLDCDSSDGGVVFTELTDLWIIVNNLIEMGIMLAGLLAVIMLVVGGIKYITSQGEPSAIQSAKKMIINSLIGLVIAIFAGTIVGFLAGSF